MEIRGRARRSLLTWKCLAYCHRFITQAPPPPSNLWPALPDWHTHPAVSESVRPSGLPGPQLRLASIWPDSENTYRLKNKSNNGRTDENEVTAPQIGTEISRVGDFSPPQQELADDRTPTKLGRLSSLYPDRNPSRCSIKKTRVKQADTRYCYPSLP